MTVRQHHGKDGPSNNLEIVKWGMSTNVFRMALLVLVLSMHPLGRQVLGTFGFKFPDEQKLVVATDEAKAVKQDIASLQKDVTDLKDVATRTTANNAIINAKLDRLESTFTGFQVDFNKWKLISPQ